MPSRIVSLLILVYWLFAAILLLTREILPDLSLLYPPDLLTIASAASQSGKSSWSIQVSHDPRNSDLQSVGEASTESRPLANGGYEMTSQVTLDSSGLLKGSPFSSMALGRLKLDSRLDVDPKGNLKTLDMKVTSDEAPGFLLTVKGRVVTGTLELVFRGTAPGPDSRFNFEKIRKFDYAPRGVVNSMLGPLDRLPRLHVGQRWETSTVNPLTNQVDQVRVEVLRRTLIDWNGQPVSTFEVVQSIPPLSSARLWVRNDGMILRQEVPLPFGRLILERERPTDDASHREETSP
jgi:hypothetical protein